MIYYNLNTIKDWNFGDGNIIKVYRNNAVCYYKITGGGDTPTAQTPCFAVVDDISQYSDTEFEDVFNKADNKWYKLNNLNQYEKYGVYGSGRTITTYDGKLTIDGDYEYQYSGGSWVNVGEVSGGSITIKSPEYIERTSTYNGYLSLQEYFTQDTKIIVKHRQTIAGGGSFIGDYFNNDNDDWRVFFASRTLYYDFITQRKSTSKTMPMSTAEEWEIGNYYIKNTATGTNLLTGTTQTFSSRPNQMYLYYLGNFGNVSDYGQVYYLKIYRNDVLIRDFIPWTDMNGNYGFYDKVENELVHSVGNMTGSSNVTDVEVGGGQPIYPKYYDEIQDPPNNLTFSSMTEAESYECPWVGMSATINGSAYTFSGDAIIGYEWVYNPIDYSTHYLSMVAQTNGVSFKYDTATSSNSLQYSLDSGSTWNILSNGQSTSSINNGEKIMFKASSLTVNTERGIGRITPSSSATVEGNIMSLAYGDNFSGQTVIPNNYQFRKLFSGVTTITSAENMVLPATSVKQQCYSQMFQGCTSLVVSPKVIGSSAMTWSGQYCLSDMFHDCTSLTTVPSGLLPATTLGERCYWCMFYGCTSLTTAPTLPATTLVSNCYLEMFKGCTNLNYIEALFTTTPSSSYMSNWVDGVASSGTFVKNSSAIWSTSCGVSTYPCNWTVQNG